MGHAHFIGRVGALAVALGVGGAVIAWPAVAPAKPSASSASSESGASTGSDSSVSDTPDSPSPDAPSDTGADSPSTSEDDDADADAEVAPKKRDGSARRDSVKESESSDSDGFEVATVQDDTEAADEVDAAGTTVKRPGATVVTQPEPVQQREVVVSSPVWSTAAPAATTVSMSTPDLALPSDSADDQPASPLAAPVLWGLLEWTRRRTATNGDSARTITVTATVDGNSAPTAGAPTVGTPDSQTGAVNGALNFTDPDGNPLTYSVVGDPARGTVVVAADGSFVYTPTQAARFNAYTGTGARGDEFTVSASDSQSTTGVTVSVPIGAAKFTVAAPVSVGYGPRGIAVSPDGTKVYVATSGENTITVIDTATNAVTATITAGSGPSNVAVSPDGSRLYVTLTGDGDGIAVIDAVTHEILTTIAADGTVPTSIAITADGARAYVANSGNHSVSVIDTASHTVIATVDVGEVPMEVLLSKDGSRAYVTSFGYSTSVIDTATNTVAATIPMLSGVWGIAVSPDGSRIYATNTGPNQVSVINAVTNTVIRSFGGFDGGPLDVVFSPDGSLAYVTNNWNASVSVVDTASEKVIATLPVGQSPYGVAVSPDGKHFHTTSLGDHTVSVVSLVATNPNGLPVAGALTIGTPDRLTGVVNGALNTADPDGDPLTYKVTGTPASGTVTVAADGTFVYTPTQAARLIAYRAPGSRSDAFVVTVSDGIASIQSTVSVPVSPAKLSLGQPVSVPGQPVNSAFSPDGTRAYVTSFFDDRVLIFDTATNTVVGHIDIDERSSPAYPQDVAVSPDGTRLYVSTSKNDVWVVDTSTNRAIRSISVPESAENIALSPDGTRAYVTGTSRNKVSVIDLVSESVVATIEGFNTPLHVAVGKDGTRAYVTNVSNGPGSVMVIDTATNTVIDTIQVPPAWSGFYPYSLSVSSDGAKLYAADFGRSKVIVINTADNTIAQTIDGPLNPTAVAVSPDGSVAYVTSQTADTVSAIDLATGATLASYSFAGHPNTISVSPDGTRIYVMRANEGLVSVLSLVEGVNSAPQSGALTVDSTDQATGVVRGHLNFTDVDGDVLTYSVTTDPAKGALVVNADGSFVYTPTALARHQAAADGASASGRNDSFIVVASDGQATATGSFGLTILPANSVPTPASGVVTIGGMPYLSSEFVMSADGKRVYVEFLENADDDHSVLAVIDTATNNVSRVPLAGVTDAIMGLSEVTPIVVSLDGRHVYLAQKNSAGEHFLAVVDVEAGTSTTVPFPRQAQLHISADGRYVYGLKQDAVSILDTASGTVTTTAVPYGVYKKLIVRPNGAGVVISDYNGVSVVDSDGTIIVSRPLSQRYDVTPSVSPDGRYVYVTSTNLYRDHLYLGVIEVASGVARELAIDATSVTVGSDGRLYTITDRSTLTVLDERGSQLGAVPLGGTYDLIVMSPDGQHLVAQQSLRGSSAPGSAVLALVDVTSTLVRTITLEHPADYVVFSPDGKRVAAGSYFSADQRFSVVDVSTAAATSFVAGDYLDPVHYAFTSDSNNFSSLVNGNDGSWALVTVDMESLTMARVDLPADFYWHYSGFTPDGHHFFGWGSGDVSGTGTIFAVDIPVGSGQAVTVGTPAAVTGAVLGSIAYVDADNDALDYSVTTAPTRGTVTIDQVTGRFTYTPTSRETTLTTDTFTILVNDGHGGRVPVVVTVPVATANVAPTVTITAPGTADPATGTAGLTVDASDANGDSLTYTFTAGKGAVTRNDDGTYSYTPTAAARHAASALNATAPDKTDTITVTVTDAEGLSATATVVVTITPQNTAPRIGRLSQVISVDPATGITSAGSQWLDLDGDNLTFTMSPASSGRGQLVLDQLGGFTFTPTAAARHAAASATASDADKFVTVVLTADDGHGGTLSKSYTVEILALNAIPVATATTGTPNSAGTVTGRVTASDADRDALTYSVGSVPTGGTVVVDAAGRFTYTPTAAARHAAAATDGTARTSDTFTLTVSDGYGGVASIPVTVQILPKNTLPTASVTKSAPDAATSATTGTIVAADTDGDILTYTVTSAPGKGAVTVDASGAFTYAPTADARHAAAKAGALTDDKRDSFTVTVSDGHGGVRAVTVSTQVLPLNAKPTGTPFVAAPDTTTGTVTGSVGGADTDGDALSYTVSRGPSRGAVTLGADGQFVYTPTAAARHTASGINATAAQKQDTFTVTVADAYGGKTAVVVTAVIAPANAGPSATATIAAPGSNGQVTGTVTATDPDGDTVKFQVTGAPVRGTVTVGSTGKFTYTPTATARHAAASLTATEDDKRDTFTITVSDGYGGTTSVTLTAAILPRNTAPTSTPTRSTPSTSTGAVEGTLGAKDADNDALTYVLTTGPTKGTVTLNADGTYSYVPTQEARIRAGSRTATTADRRDTFTITVSDGYGGTKAVTITATIVGISV